MTTSAPYSPAPKGELGWINVLDHWLAGDASADVTAARAVTFGAQFYPGGYVLYFPSGYYPMLAPIVIAQDNVQVIGDGWGSQLVCQPAFAGAAMIIVQQPGAGVFRYGIKIADLFLNLNNVGSVGGLDLQTTYAAEVQHLRIRFCKGIAIHMDGTPGNTGAYNHIRGCHVTDGGAGVGLQTDNSEWLTVEGGLFAFYNSPGGIGIKMQNLNCRMIGVGFDNNDTGIDLEFAGRNAIVGCQFDRGQLRFIYLHGTQYCTVTGCSFNTYNGTVGTGVLDVTDGNNAGNVIVGNTLKGGSGWTNFIDEHGTVGAPSNIYAHNDVGGAAVVLVAGAGIARGNVGYNPVGHAVAQPAVPASTTPQTNTTGVDCSVFVNGGTVSAVAIGGTTTGQIAGEFRVPAGQTITLTYSVAPTWQWFGD